MNTTSPDITHFYLANILKDYVLKQVDLARYIQSQVGVPISPSSFNKWIKGQRTVKRFDSHFEAISDAVKSFLSVNGVPAQDIAKMWDKGVVDERLIPERYTKGAIYKRQRRAMKKQIEQELLQKQTNTETQPEPEMLSSKTLAHFKLHRDPFENEITCAADLFLHQQQRYAREQMLHAVQNGTILALIAESGAGKSQVRRSFYQAINQAGDKIRIIEPEVIDKSELTPGMIMAAIADELDIKHMAHSREKAARQVKKHLQQLVTEQGFKFALVIEEAHDLTDKVLKYLKRIWEWDDGFKKLIAIILIGQTELKGKLAQTQLQVREFSRRCHQVELYPLADSMGDYLAHKLERAGQSIDKVMTTEAILHLRNKLKSEISWGNHRPSENKDHSYPLTVNAWAANAMNRCVQLGEPIVTPAIIDKVTEGY